MASKKIATKTVSPVPPIERRILLLRGQKVMLDADLAELYGVETRRLNEQVRRNAARFPEDFMFQLSAEETQSLRSQFATLKPGRGQHRKYLPYVFTEHGALMAANVLNSRAAAYQKARYRFCTRRRVISIRFRRLLCIRPIVV